jgi:ribosomal-protein-alanine N-acetyltransferase
MNLTGTIKLESPRLTLRRGTIEDAEEMFKNWASDDEVTKYLTWDSHKTIYDTIEILKMWDKQYGTSTFFQWLIELKSEQIPIGAINLFSVNLKDESCEIGYCLSRKYWCRGYVSEACREILNFAFNIVGFRVVYARHEIHNPASGRIMEKNGMKYFKTTEEFSKKLQSILKTHYYIIRKEEFR